MYNYHRIKDLRDDNDMSQEKTAKELNMHKTTYARYETGENRVPFDFAIQIAEFYGVSLDYIAGRTNDKKGLTRSEMSDVETELIKKFRSLSEGGKNRILERLDVILETEAEENAKLKGAV